LILQVVLKEDASGPSCIRVIREKYIARLSSRFRKPIDQILRETGITVSKIQLDEICHLAADEAFMIRALREAWLAGDLLLEDFCHLPVYRSYQDYFGQPPIVSREALAWPLLPPRPSGWTVVTQAKTHRS